MNNKRQAEHLAKNYEKVQSKVYNFQVGFVAT